MKPYYQKSGITLYNADCRDVAKFVKCDFILTDPPYPDYHTDKWEVTPIDFLNDFSCRQFVFWSAKVEFPLSYTARHVWDKNIGAGSQYEFIYERNGNAEYKVFRFQSPTNIVRARGVREYFSEHPSQKPVQLLNRILVYANPEIHSVIFDPFSGSGSTLVSAKDLGYQAIGCEKIKRWANETVERLAQQSLFTLPNKACSGQGDSAAQSEFILP